MNLLLLLFCQTLTTVLITDVAMVDRVWMVSATTRVVAQQDILVITVKRVGWRSPQFNYI